MPETIPAISGLTQQQVIEARNLYGSNALEYKKENSFLSVVKSLLQEPMVILLLVASVIYFISGKTGDGIFLALAIVLVSAISLYQDSRSRDALEKLKSYTEPTCKVIRSGEVQTIKSDDLVVGDSLMVEEGIMVPADGRIVQSNDFSVNESILTGEALSVYKDTTHNDPFVYRGTTVVSGLAIVTITETGNRTRLGNIGSSLEKIQEEKSPLEIQIADFVKKMVIAGTLVFILVWVLNYLDSHSLPDSLLKALTLAMSILPEEIPVAFTTFMSLGAWRLMKLGVVVKQMKIVETLGSATVICTDKTGTITENKMSLARLYTWEDRNSWVPEANSLAANELLTLAMWASEPIPFDPMEVALHEAYVQLSKSDDRPLYQLVHEYPLGGKPPMMTHIHENGTGHRIIAAKGAPEALMQVSKLSDEEKEVVSLAIHQLTSDGYRVLGVGEAIPELLPYPEQQQELNFAFKGLIAFYDPPKQNIGQVFEAFYKAGIEVKIVTGDNAFTTLAIARQVGFRGYEKSISGEQLMRLNDEDLRQQVSDTRIFTRMFPEAKLRIINALKANHEVVAMTGDGVNDGPALKAAHIGVAMGKKGTEIARQAASMILLEDDLARMVDAVAMGRKIYTNLKKAIQYIISIHIPIILTVFIPLVLGWVYPSLFSPIHIIFLELIMGPTCSIIYENEPMEENTMIQKPRPFTTTFFSWNELTTSMVQGLIITVGTLSAYQYSVAQGYGEELTRTMVFTTLVVANIVLTLVNRSFFYSILTTIRYKNPLVGLIIAITLSILAALIYIRPFAAFFGFEELSLIQLFICILIGKVSVIWYELFKYFRRMEQR